MKQKHGSKPLRPQPKQALTRARILPARILVDVDPVMPAGIISGRYDITITGRVSAAAPIGAITLRHANQELADIACGGAPRAGIRNGRATTHLRAFRLTLALPPDYPADTLDAQLIVSTVDGNERIHDIVIELDPARAAPARLAPFDGPADRRPDSIDDFNAYPDVIVYTEKAAIRPDGSLGIHGWAVSLTPLNAIEVLIPGQAAAAARLGLQRGDVATAFPGYANARMSGFEAIIPLNRKAQVPATVQLRAACPNGLAYQVTLPVEQLDRPARITASTRNRKDSRAAPESTIHLFCDRAAIRADGLLRVAGWAVSESGINRVDIAYGGAAPWRAELGLERPDVASIFPDLPTAGKSGFRFSRDGVAIAGPAASVHIVAHDHAGGIAELIVPMLNDAMPPAVDLATADAPPPEFSFGLDMPLVVEGEVVEPVTGRLSLEGWVLSRAGIAAIDVLLDGRRVGEAHYGLTRQDVGAAFPDWPNSTRSGFTFHCPPRTLRDGRHTLRLVIRATNGQVLTQDFGFSVKRTEGLEQATTIRRRISGAEGDVMLGLLADLKHRPMFHLLLLQSRVIDLDALRTTLDSLRHQVYGKWDLTVLAVDRDTANGLSAAVVALDDDGQLTGRVTVIGPHEAAWSAPLVQPPRSGGFVGPLRPGDALGCDALAELALGSGMYPGAEVVYADEARFSPASHEREPFFKPDYSPDLLLSTNYIGRPWIAASRLLARVGVTPQQLMTQGEYDLVLRCCEAASSVHHVPRLLCERGPAALDDTRQEREALRMALQRQNDCADVLPATLNGTWRLRRKLAGPGKVSIIIPTCAAQGRIETCIRTLRERTSYRDFEIVCIENIPDSDMPWRDWVKQHADKTLHYNHEFNWSQFNNHAVKAATGEYLLFLNDDIEVTQADWLDALLEHAQRPKVAVVGAQLLYPEGRVQHAGMFLSGSGVGRHAFRFAAADEPGYFGLALTQRNVIAVTGACMLMRRAVFEQLGGFDEAHAIVNNDLDFCLRAHRAGLRVIYTPYASLIHHERTSRDRMPDLFDYQRFDTAWRTTFASGDPYFSPWLSSQTDDYRPDDEPTQAIYAGHPKFNAADIRRILVVKLDHIGDFITALPAIRELKRQFPQATITVLSGEAARAFAAIEPAIDDFLDFEFFHARSQLGERELTDDDFTALRARLKPYRFDLAIDLRKQLDTRDVLRHTGARYFAGFDQAGRYPFLDVAVEWDGDRALHRKRSHIADDLLSLVRAVEVACHSDRTLIDAGALRPALERLPLRVRRLFDKPVVIVHPGAGNITKQWPEAHYAALLDLLIERDGVNVLLVGGPEEADLAHRLCAGATDPSAIGSVVGLVSLSDLPTVLTGGTLFIGNDSGPKHIAAAMGVPTIGLHSGVVDADEWGPVGPRAVALRRNMSCGPCYLARAEDCSRALACLKFLEPAVVHRVARQFLGRPVVSAAGNVVTLDTTGRRGKSRRRPAIRDRALAAP